MKTQKFLIVLTLLNLGLLGWQAFRTRTASAEADGKVLRGTGLEIVDDQGRVRLSVKVEPANPTYKWPDGTKVGIPETVMMKMSTADGKPRIKFGTSVEGSGLMLLGDSDTTHAILKADQKDTSLLLRNNEETQKVLKP